MFRPAIIMRLTDQLVQEPSGEREQVDVVPEQDVLLARRAVCRHDLRRYPRLVAVALREFAGQRFCHPQHHLAPGRHAYMISALRQSGETLEYRESPVHGLSHLDLADGHSFALVPDSAVGRVPIGTATIAITDDLPRLTLEMVWRRDAVSAALGVLVSTARELARREGWYVS